MGPVGRFITNGIGKVIGGLGGTLLHLIGLSKPATVATPMPLYITPAPNHSLADGIDTAVPGGMFLANAVSSDPDIFGWSADHMSLLTRAMMPGIIGVWSFDGTKDTGDLLAEIHVHPICGLADGITLHRSPLGFVASNFAYWRGGIKYHFRFFAPRTMTTRVRISWHAGIPAATTANATGDVPNILLDISGDTDCSFTVPWSGSIWREMCEGRGLALTNGLLRVNLVNPVIAADYAASSVVYFVVFAAADTDMQFNQRVLPGVNGLSYTDPLVAPQASEHEVFRSAFAAIGSGRSVHYDKVCMGEQPVTFRELLKQYENVTPQSSTPYHPPLAQEIFKVGRVASPVQADILSGYRFCRGTFRYRFVMGAGPVTSFFPFVYLAAEDQNTDDVSVTPWNIAFQSSDSTQIRVGAIDCPWFRSEAFEETNDLTSNRDMDFINRVMFTSFSVATTDAYFNAYAAYGDDFSLGWPVAPNPIYIDSFHYPVTGMALQQPRGRLPTGGSQSSEEFVDLGNKSSVTKDPKVKPASPSVSAQPPKAVPSRNLRA